MLVVVHLLTRRLFAVPFEFARVARAVVVMAAVAVAGDLLLPTDGVDGFLLRALAVGVAPVLLVATRVVTPADIARIRGMIGRGSKRSSGVAGTP
jgi:hypothetical protein